MFMKLKKQTAFTLVELVIVLVIMASLFALVGNRTGTANRIREESFIRQLREVISFLYNQSIADQSEYVLNFNITKEGNFSYNVGTFNSGNNEQAEQYDLRNFYYQQISYPKEVKRDMQRNNKYAPKGKYKAKGFYGTRKEREEREQQEEMEEGRSFSPAPNFPSLAEEKTAPDFLKIKDIVVFDTKYTPQDIESTQIIFSPKGFVDFSVIHLYNDRGKEYTLQVNPFTGITERYDEYKDFEWTFNDK